MFLVRVSKYGGWALTLFRRYLALDWAFSALNWREINWYKHRAYTIWILCFNDRCFLFCSSFVLLYYANSVVFVQFFVRSEVTCPSAAGDWAEEFLVICIVIRLDYDRIKYTNKASSLYSHAWIFTYTTEYQTEINEAAEFSCCFSCSCQIICRYLNESSYPPSLLIWRCPRSPWRITEEFQVCHSLQAQGVRLCKESSAQSEERISVCSFSLSRISFEESAGLYRSQKYPFLLVIFYFTALPMDQFEKIGLDYRFI